MYQICESAFVNKCGSGGLLVGGNKTIVRNTTLQSRVTSVFQTSALIPPMCCPKRFSKKNAVLKLQVFSRFFFSVDKDLLLFKKIVSPEGYLFCSTHKIELAPILSVCALIKCFAVSY
jgi:hypothetical protein